MTKQKIKIDADTGELDAVTDDLADAIESAGGERETGLIARVYRQKAQAANGRPVREFCGKFDHVLDEEEVGENFGSGVFVVFYSYHNKAGELVRTSRQLTIGPEFEKPKERETAAAANLAAANVPAAPASNILGGLLGNITAEKIAGGLTLLKALKEFLAPPPPAIDYTKLLEIIASQNRGQSVSDAVMIKAMEQLNKPAPAAPSVMQQINDLKAVRDAFKDDFQEKENGGDKMDFFIDQALKFLPALLQKNNNNFNQVGAEARQNALVNSIIGDNPELTQKFFNVAAEKYGMEAAQQLAAGFGFNLTENEPAAAQAETAPAINGGI